MQKIRLDQLVVQRGLVISRSQAESHIKLGNVLVDGTPVTRAGTLVWPDVDVRLLQATQYVSRAGLKLASVAGALNIDFTDKIVLDVGSSTGGFTDYALQNGAEKVIAVELGTDQLHKSLHGDERIELHEKTDIRRYAQSVAPKPSIDIVVMDVSFISLREILPYVAKLCSAKTDIVAMVKPQFEARKSNATHKGVIKNEKLRRDILKDFEDWAKQSFVIKDKADSDIAGAKGNRERFYLLRATR
jgi:23S rRNA (cytidine1920-2'-O)/16S rRNA (cytidine1409-2'-O)-methyltransferase